MSDRTEDAGDVEYATQGGGDYPHRWGVPRGKRFSEERSAWVKDRVLAEMRCAPIRARIQLMRRRYPPTGTTP